MSLWEERAAGNEALFREVNEQVRSLSSGQRRAEELLIICECSDDQCRERVSVRLSVYEAARSNPRRFLVVPGHENDFERVDERADGCSIVEKEGQAGHVAQNTAITASPMNFSTVPPCDSTIALIRSK
jgi:hypothetical protein